MIGDPSANFYEQKPIGPIVSGPGNTYGHYLRYDQRSHKYVHTQKGDKVILWMAEPENDAQDRSDYIFDWDDDLLLDPKNIVEMEAEIRRHRALIFEADQIRYRYSIAYWFPLKKYDNLDNPYMDLSDYEGD